MDKDFDINSVSLCDRQLGIDAVKLFHSSLMLQTYKLERLNLVIFLSLVQYLLIKSMLPLGIMTISILTLTKNTLRILGLIIMTLIIMAPSYGHSP
jgi:hypothetical protein